MNIKILYLYRDAGNYKNFGEVVFSNVLMLPIAKVEATLKKYLIDGQWFVADQWGLPDLHFKEFDWDSELDLDWHEWEGMEETKEVASVGEIGAFLEMVKIKSEHEK